ncbi:unnamed protein product, partial [Staurois parvus]
MTAGTGSSGIGSSGSTAGIGSPGVIGSSVEMSELFKNSIWLIRRIRGINSIRVEYIRCE